MRYQIAFVLGLMLWSVTSDRAKAIEVNPVLTDINSNIFFNGPITITRTGFNGNVVRRFTIDNAATTGGGSFVIAVSNGENGFNVGPPGNSTDHNAVNNDVPNPTPVGAAIDIVNGGDGTMGNKLTNGNAFRFSVWIQQDPASPVTVETSVEPILKFELWSEAQSINGDFDQGRAIGAAYGDRLWDTDINARNVFYDGFNQSVSSPIDISGNNTVVSGDTPVVSIPPATGEQWVRVETTIVLDDDPDDSGFGWEVHGQGYKINRLEEVRATFFTGDFGAVPSTQLDNGGSFFVDNALLEIFPDKATMLATPNPNPMPGPALTGDYNDNGIVDTADYAIWRKLLNQPGNLLINRDPNVTGLIKPADYTVWRARYGNTLPGSGSDVSGAIMAYAPVNSVPEPGSLLLGVIASLSILVVRRQMRSA